MKPTDFLALAGFLSLFVHFWFDQTGRALPEWLQDAWLVRGGSILVALGLLARVPDLIRSAGARRMKYGTNTAVFVALVAGILGGVNWMANRYPKRLDVSKDARFSLSDQTTKLLAGLTSDLTISYVQRNAASTGAAKDLLSQYAAASPRVRLEYIDPRRDPSRTRALDVQQLPTIVVSQGDRHEKVLIESEEEVTNGILKLSRTKKKTVCFASGEGEKDYDDASERGYSSARTLIARSQYELRKIVLLQEQGVPADCTVLVVASPAKDLLPETAAYIKSFVRAGGKALLMSDPAEKTPTPNYDGVFTDFGVKPGADVVVDASGAGQLFGTGPFMPIVVDYPYHDINKDLKGTMTLFDMARSMTPATPMPDGVTVQELARTSNRSWGESDTTLAEPIEFTDRDVRGPMNLAVAITVRPATAAPSPETAAASPAPSPDAKSEGRVVAVGDSGFGSNALLTFQANPDLFMNMIAWLAQDADLISIRPKDPESHRITMTSAEQRNFILFALFVLPGFFIVWGIVTWWRRRS